MDEWLDLWKAPEMLNESRKIYVVMVMVLEKGWQQTERTNVASFRELMKVHRIASSNVAK